MSKYSRFRGPFDKQHGKGDQKLLTSEPYHIYRIYSSLWRQMSWNKYLLVICKFWRLFVNTFTADDKYSLLNTDNLKHPIQMQITQKQKPISQLVSAFPKSILNFQRFQENDDPHSWCISEILNS